jgi:YVTN family beta-propeller protein
LPTGVHLDSAGELIKLGSMPQAFAVAPGTNKVVVLLGGWREQGVQVVDLSTRQVTQNLPQEAAFVGLGFSPDGRSLYASGDDSIYCYSWDGGSLSLQRKIQLSEKPPVKMGTRFPAGLAISPDGKQLYVAENVAHTMAVIDLSTNIVVQRLPTDHYPYAVVASTSGEVYVSAWGGDTVSVFRVRQDGKVEDSGRITVGRHPSALLLNASGSRLFAALASTDQVAIIDTRQRRVLSSLHTSAPGSPPEGSTPNGLALSEDGSRLFVAEADSNDVSVFQLSKDSSGKGTGGGRDQLIGRIPADWYPTGVIAHQGKLLVLTGKGLGTGPNPNGPRPSSRSDTFGAEYTLGQTSGTLRFMSSTLTPAELDSLSRRVEDANRWSKKKQVARYPQFKHVVYIIKENRTYDQLLGDIPEGDGDPSLVFFGYDTTPNHHELAKRFGLFDRFFVNAEVSSQGHMWSTAAYVTDYVEKVIPSVYTDRRGEDDEGDVDMPSTGYLWDLARAKGVTFRDYGEWLLQPGAARSKGVLDQYIDHDYPPFDMTIPDQRRADAWIAELKSFVSKGAMPQLEILHLPGDHTAGGRAGLCTPRACVADNDLALGRIVEALSHSPFWSDTVIFVAEDDAQSGSDHIDSHRAPFLAISAYNRPGTNHRFMNTTDVVAATEDILGLGKLSQYDYFSRPLSDIFSPLPDLTPYTTVAPIVPIDERNPGAGEAAKQSANLDLSSPDRIPDAEFNDILWKMMKANQARPPVRNQSPIQLLQSTGY